MLEMGRVSEWSTKIPGSYLYVRAPSWIWMGIYYGVMIIVIAGLPNQGEPLSAALADAIQPRLIVIADSEFPPTRHAGTKLRERLEQRGVPVIYTSDSGAVRIVVDETGWRWKTADGPEVLSPQISQMNADEIPQK
jgi:hypothetical protein